MGKSTLKNSSWKVPFDSSNNMDVLCNLSPDLSIPKALYDKATKLHKSAYEAGFNEGKNAAIAEYKTQVDLLTNLVSGFKKDSDSARKSFAQTSIDVVIAICQAVIRHELTINKKAIQALIEEAVMLIAPEDEVVSLKLNPLDAEFIENLKQQHILNFTNELKIIKDESITQGGAIIESKVSKIDATIENRFHEILNESFDNE